MNNVIMLIFPVYTCNRVPMCIYLMLSISKIKYHVVNHINLKDGQNKGISAISVLLTYNIDLSSVKFFALTPRLSY